MSASDEQAKHAALRRRIDDLPAGVTGEVIDGALQTRRRARPGHQFASNNIAGDLALGRYGGGPPAKGWLILPDVEILFANLESAVPDISGWRTERVTGHEDENPMTVIPDWVCEILSDSTRTKDVGPKRDLYARQGIKHLWLVDADERYVEAFALNEQSRWVLLGTWTNDAVMAVAPFEGTPLGLGNWWMPRG